MSYIRLHKEENSSIVFFQEVDMSKAKDKMLGRIHAKAAGWVFLPKDFLDLVGRGTVDKLLHQLAANGTIRRIMRGLYFQPRHSDFLKAQIGPTHDQIAQAVARKHRWTILPQGATAANMLGLSQQIPAKVAYLSNGPTKTFKSDQLQIEFRHAQPKELDFKQYESAMVVQAMRYMGKENIQPWMVARLREVLPDKVKRRLVADTRYATEWMFRLAQEIAEVNA